MSGSSKDISSSYNLRSPAVKRILKEVNELQKNKSTLFCAAPLEENIFEIHFTLRGPRGTAFEGGLYHGKILLPTDYPLKPPDFVFLTPNGRFEVGKKICLTISSHHAETWSASWSVRTALLAIIAFMPTAGDGAVASLDWSDDVRKKLAVESLSYKCDSCGAYTLTALPPEDVEEELDIGSLSEQIQLRDPDPKRCTIANTATNTNPDNVSSSNSSNSTVINPDVLSGSSRGSNSDDSNSINSSSSDNSISTTTNSAVPLGVDTTTISELTHPASSTLPNSTPTDTNSSSSLKMPFHIRQRKTDSFSNSSTTASSQISSTATTLTPPSATPPSTILSIMDTIIVVIICVLVFLILRRVY